MSGAALSGRRAIRGEIDYLLTDYYDMKFSVNPQEIAILQDQSRRTLDWRMNMNLTFAVGLEKLYQEG